MDFVVIYCTVRICAFCCLSFNFRSLLKRKHYYLIVFTRVCIYTLISIASAITIMIDIDISFFQVYFTINCCVTFLTAWGVGKAQVQMCRTNNSGYLFEYRERGLGFGATNLLNCNSAALKSTINVVLKLTNKQIQIMSHKSHYNVALFLWLRNRDLERAGHLTKVTPAFIWP